VAWDLISWPMGTLILITGMRTLLVAVRGQ